MLGTKQQISHYKNILIYKVILKPIWYPITENSQQNNLEILQRIENVVLRAITGVLSYVENNNADVISSIKEEIHSRFQKYVEKAKKHSNRLAR